MDICCIRYFNFLLSTPSFTLCSLQLPFQVALPACYLSVCLHDIFSLSLLRALSCLPTESVSILPLFLFQTSIPNLEPASERTHVVCSESGVDVYLLHLFSCTSWSLLFIGEQRLSICTLLPLFSS